MKIKKFFLSFSLGALSSTIFASCPDVTTYCYSYELDSISPIPYTSYRFKTGSKWDWKSVSCKPLKSKNAFLKECMRRNHNTHAVVYPKGTFKVSPSYGLVNYSWPGFSSENWMEGLRVRFPQFAKAAIKNIILPGTHDSGSYNITTTSSYSPDNSYTAGILKWFKYLEYAQLVYVHWSKTQPYNIHKQLLNGMRYFDIRICGKKNSAYTCHAKFSDSFSNIINQIKRFTDKPENSHELIILDLNHFYDMTSTAHELLISELIQKLGTKIASGETYSVNNSLNDFWQDKKQIIIFYNDYEYINRYPILWSSGSIDSIWPNKQRANDLIKTLDGNQSRRAGSTGFYVIQSQLSADGSNIKDALYKPFVPHSIHDNTLTYKQKIYDWLYSNKNKIKEYGNIIIEDWSNGKALAHYAITMNAEKYKN